MPRHHSNFLTDYVRVVTPHGEAPERFHYWCAAVALAGALRRRVYIDEGTFRWYPNMYVVLVGPPGTVKKSTTMNVAMRLLREVPNVHFGADSTTWESFVAQVEAAEDVFAEGDLNAHDLMNQDHVVSCAITLAISEWGTFLNPENPDLINVMTELWDCKIDTPFRKATKTQGDNVLMNPFVNMIAATTPKWMQDNFRGKFGGWGFSSRCIFMHCSQPERLVAYPHKSWGQDFDRQMKTFREDLIDISRLQGKYKITPQAEEYGEAWYTEHMQRKVALDEHPNHDPWLSYYLARKFDHAHKLSIVIAAAKRSQLSITLEDLQEATARCDEVENELAKVFKTERTQHRDAKLAQDVLEGLLKGIEQSGGQIEERKAYAFSIRYMTYGRVKEMLDGLVTSRILSRSQDVTGTWLSAGENAPTQAA